MTQTVHTLTNPIYWFLQRVFILDLGKNKYRLIARHHNKIIYDNVYETLRGAKIGFSKLYQYKLWKEDVKAMWSPQYETDQEFTKIEVKTL